MIHINEKKGGVRGGVDGYKQLTVFNKRGVRTKTHPLTKINQIIFYMLSMCSSSKSVVKMCFGSY